jgi:hypothetical protein
MDLEQFAVSNSLAVAFASGQLARALLVQGTSAVPDTADDGWLAFSEDARAAKASVTMLAPLVLIFGAPCAFNLHGRCSSPFVKPT